MIAGILYDLFDFSRAIFFVFFNFRQRKDPDFSLFLLKKMSEKLIKNTGKRTELRYLSGKERYLKAMDRHRLIGDLATLTKKQLCYETSLPLRSLNRIIRDCSDTYQYKNRGFFRVNNS